MINGLSPRTGKIKNFTNIAAFDIETTEWTKFVIAGIFDGTNYYEFRSPKKLVEHITKRKYSGHTLYAHFGGKFDFLFLLDHIRHKTSIIEIGGSIIELKIRLDEKNIVRLRDSFRLLPAKLSKLGDAFQTKNRKDVLFNIEDVGYNQETREYLKLDNMSLYEVLISAGKLIKSIGGETKLTIASTAMDIFCRKHLDRVLLQSNYDDFSRLGYYGGRVENIVKYAEGINVYDINSLYPSVMANKFYPCGKSAIFKSIGKEYYNFEGIAEIETCIPSMLYPPLPVRTKENLIFPTGKIKGNYPFPFLRLLDEMGIRFKINQALVFSDRAEIFNSYVNTLYQIKKENNNNALGYIVKLLLNSLYGKFAQKVERTNYILNPDKIDFEKGLEIVHEKSDLWKFTSESKPGYILPHLSAYVTSYAQIRLYELINISKPVYYDTDSIFTELTLPTGKDLGELKLEKQLERVIFLAPKLYAGIDADGKEYIRAKGFNARDINFRTFENVLFKNGALCTEDEHGLMGIKSAIKQKGKFVYRKKVHKSFLGNSKKREFKGNESIPLQVEMY